MKKAIIITLCILLCGLTSIGIASAYKEGYSHLSYSQVNAVTLDGQWTPANEYTDCLDTAISANAVFRDKWEAAEDFSSIWVKDIIEVTTDTAADTGDYVQICIDGLADGGTAPQADDYKIVLTPTTATWYKGTGTTWAAMETPATSSFKWATSISASPTSSTPHRIYEVQYEKMTLSIGSAEEIGVFWKHISVYDAGNSEAGVQAWPPTSADVPNDYGNIPWTQDAIPEGLSFGIVLALSSIAIIAGAVLVRKRPEITKFVTV